MPRSVPTRAHRLVCTPPPPAEAPRLDDAQRRVVDHDSGPLLVLAGPGTGKTTTLVEAVAARVRAGCAPDEVLVLTFSRRAAEELRERITSRLDRTVTEPSAYTFHSFCYALVRAYDTAPGEGPPRLLSGAERDVRLRDLLAGHAAGDGRVRWPAALRPALQTRGFAAEVADLFDRARERGLDGAGLRRLGREGGRPAWEAAGEFLDEYLDVLDARRELDYAGLVRRAVAVLARPPVAAEAARRWRWVYVDEYQDTDPSQEQLLSLLAGGGRDLVVVGDPDQSIYAFRGADVGGILQFPHRFPRADGAPAPVVTLSVSRRAGAALREPARRVAERIPLAGLGADVRRRHRELDAQGPATATTPQIRLYPTVAAEVTAVADLLRRAHLQDGLPWSQMAVLVRSGVRSLPVLRRALVAAGVPVSVAADEVPVAQEPAVTPLLTALRVADAGLASVTPEEARQLLGSPLARALPSGLRLLGRRLRALERAGGALVPHPSAELVRDALVDPRELATVEDWAAEPVRRLHGLLTRAAALLASGGSPEEALWLLWDGSGWGRRLEADWWRGGTAARSADRDLDAVLALFEAAARLEAREPRAGVRTLLDELQSQRIPAAPLEERAGAPDAVRLLTAHRSKGLEWDLVVVSGVQDGVWPDLRRRGSLLDPELIDRDGIRAEPTRQDLLVDERRLFYVALTRARRRVVLTAVQSFDDDGEQPSRFLAETGLPMPATTLGGTSLLSTGSLVARLRAALQDPQAEPGVRAAAARQLAELADARGGDGQPLVAAADPGRWWGTADLTPGAAPVRPADEPIQLSASAVQAFTACPLRWFLEREVRAAGGSSAAQGFGTVLHALAQLVSEGVLPPDADVLLERLDTVWGSLGFEARWQRDREREEARAALDRFVTWLTANPRAVAAAEHSFEVSLGDAVLRGSADRLEVDADGRVHVVDFKTGRSAVSKVDLERHPQLGVYQLAVREGGFAELVGADAPLGGAELVHLRQERSGGRPHVQAQAALPDGPSWADELVAQTAKGVRQEEFVARPNDACPTCAFRACCPAQEAGRQVVE